MKGRVRQDATIHATSIYRFVTTSVKYIYLLCEIYMLPTLCESYQLDILRRIWSYILEDDYITIYRMHN